MYRTIENDLFQWRSEMNRKPLLIRGARQIGKSFVVEKFGREHFAQLITINFEFSPEYLTCFNTLDPQQIVKAIELLAGRKVVMGETLLFFDEIQLCPKAIISLRYFKEKMPALHVIGAGSFLEFVINNDRYQQPVGRVQSLYMRPCSFREFLMAKGEQHLVEFLADVHMDTEIDEAIHERLLERTREYFILGGMPEVIDYYIRSGKYQGCEKIHSTILEYYRRDFSKYDERINSNTLERVFTKAPGLIAQCFKYVDVDPNIAARDQKPSVEALVKAGIINKVHHSAANGLPLQLGMNEKIFKLLFLDIGLVNHAVGLETETLLHNDLLLINRGALAEQFVGQELMAYGRTYQQPELFFWAREKKSSSAEVDYLFPVGTTIYPIEVKAGKTGSLRSLQVFLNEKKQAVGVRISQHPFSFDRRVLSIPIYMIHELQRLLKECSSKWPVV